MIEKTILDYLTDALTPIPVAMEVPTQVPDTYVIVQKTGSGENNRLSAATFAIQSVAPSLYDAALLNDRVKRLMRRLPALENVFRCDCNSDYEFSNPQTKERRYQAVFEIEFIEE